MPREGKRGLVWGLSVTVVAGQMGIFIPMAKRFYIDVNVWKEQYEIRIETHKGT
jgi:hypothetical protein